MERRLLLAITLMIVVAVLPSLFMRSTARRARVPPGAEGPAAARADSAAIWAQTETRPPAAARAPVVERAGAPAGEDTVAIVMPRSRYSLGSVGASLTGAELTAFRSFPTGGTVDLIREGDRLLAQRLVLGNDTVPFDRVPFVIERGDVATTFHGGTGALVLTVSYAPVGGRDYLLEVTGEISGLGGQGALLLVSLGSGLVNAEADSVDNYRHYGVVGRRASPENQPFAKLRPGETALLSGPFDWVAVKSKYFMVALLSPDSTRPMFGGAVVTGGPRTGRTATHAETWVTVPVGPDGRFRYKVYSGPMEYRTLRPLGRELDKASPYGWIFRPLVMPVSVWITQLLIWMHENLRLGYGWVLVLFGVLVRLLLWPLNQKAMKSSVAMQAIQPHLKDVQARYKDDPQRLQQEMMKLYREHKVNPLGGCLPMLLPFPVLLALFFVFANTIEFRGVSFLWLPDLSQRDPLYVIPVVMGASMFALTKLGQMGMPPNPQAKMMMTIMPVMMTVLFLNFASGLNLYYAVSNIVSLPQQYLINKAREAELARRKGR